MTRYEKKIYEIINSSYDHMTAEDVFAELKKAFPSVSLATVYNNLNKLWAAGLVRKISLQGMPDRYDRVERHDHLVCRGCGRLVDIGLADLTGQLQEQTDVPILAYDLKLIYLCDDCKQKLQRERSL